MKLSNNPVSIPVHLFSIAKSIFSLKKSPRGRGVSSRLSRPNSAAIGIAFAVLLVSVTLSASMFWRGGSVAAFAESIGTYDLNSCANPTTANSKTTFVLGDKVWATVTGAALPDPIFGIRQRRFQWIAPDFTLAKQADSTAATDCDDYDLPTTGPFAQAGTWIVRTIDNSASGVSFTTFVVRDPARATADVSISIFGPGRGSAGGSLTYRVDITNKGPDTAQNITITDSAPANTTFVSSTVPSCTDPSPPGCGIGSLAAGDTASFTFVYNINGGTPNETLISNTVQVSSTTAEPSQASESNNSSTSVASVVNQAGSPCTISCPEDILADNDPNSCNAVVNYTTPVPSGSCTDSATGQTVSVSCNPPSGSVFPIGATTVTCNIQSEGTSVTGNACSFTVTVHDTHEPVQLNISCPSDVTANENPPGSNSATVGYAQPTTTGNCATASCDPPSGSGFRVGTTVVTCTATDSSNNTVTCSFNVVVHTSTCALDCPEDKTVTESSPGSGSATVTYSSPATGGTCPPLTITCTPASGSSFPVGTTQVSCTGSDASNVVSSCSFRVTVNSSSTCTITCPADITTNATPSGSSSATVTYATPTGTCASISCNPPSGSSFPIGTTTVHCNGTDAGGNTRSCSFTVRVIGGTPCVITCPADITQASDPDGCTKVVTYATPTTSGSCGGDPNANPPIPTPPPACNPPSGSTFPVGITTVTCSTDVGAECSFTITITGTDAVPPVITSCAAATFGLADATGQAAIPNVTNDVAATDNCTPTNLLTVTQSPVPGTLVGVGTTSITLTVTDANNNSTTCTTTFKVCVFESNPPTAVCKNITVALNAGGTASITGSDVDNGSNDDCGIASRTVTPSFFTCANIGPNPVTLTVTDPSGNSASCQSTVTVIDNIAPTITCPASTSASANSSCQAAVPNVLGGVIASDNCTPAGSLVVTQSPAAGTIVGVGTTTITVTVRDASNNFTTCTTTFTVSDTTPPTALCKNITISLNASGNASIAAADVDNGSSDNCGVTSRTVSPSSFTCANLGPNTVILTVKDAANNTSTCQATVTVVDTIPPTITCVADINVDFDPAVNGAVVTYTTPVGTDNCAGATTVQIAGLPSGATFPAGNTTNTFRVTDTSGNSAQCSFKVTVALTSIIGLDSVSITGSGLVDSYSSAGGYPATKGSLANVLSNGAITIGGSSKVFGNVRSTRAGVTVSGTSQLTGNATAGTTVSVIPSGTVGGTITNNQLAPVMTLPSVPACGPPYSPNSGISGTYSYNPSTGDLTLSGVNVATLANGTYCFHNVTLTNSAQLKVNGPVVIKITGTLSASGATSLPNTTGIPSNLQILSSYTGSNGVTLGNGTNLNLVIYAPKTNVTITGAAPLFGTVVGKTVTLSNSGMIHYDTQLKNIWPALWALIQ